MMEMVLFFVLAVVAVAAGVGVVAQRHAARSALYLLVNFCCLAGLYILLNAQFLAVVQIIIYAGAVVVLFLFVVMLLGIERIEEKPNEGGSGEQRRASAITRRFQWIGAVLLGALLLAGLIWAVIGQPLGQPLGAAPTGGDNVRLLGTALLTGYAIPFELASVVLLVAIVGAVVLAKKRLEG